MDEEGIYYFSFSHFLGIGPVRFNALIQKFGSAQRAFRAGRQEIADLLGNRIAERFAVFRSGFQAQEKLRKLERMCIRVIPLCSPDYPRLLREIPDPPICLYIRGKLSLGVLNTALCFGVVGTRNPSEYGERIAEIFGGALSKSGTIIVSGMALGVDTIAHNAAINSYGITVAVLGCGVDIVYPSYNYRLYEEIVQKSGLVISEIPPGFTVQKGFFIARNRIISGLSKGILVVEGLKDSGTLITARFAAEQGRDVFVLPVPLTSELSQAPNILIKNGAKVATGPEDILEEYGLRYVKQKDRMEEMSEKELKIYLLLRKRSRFMDDLIADTRLRVEELSNILSLLELKSRVKKNREGKYQAIIGSDFIQS